MPARKRSAGNDVAADDNNTASPPPTPERPLSVREQMALGRRYDPVPSRSAPSRRRKPRPPQADLPPSARELADGPVAEIPTREVEFGDGLWKVVVRGSSTTGSGDVQGARLLSVGLEAPGDRPNPEGTHYLAAQRLEEVDEEVLRELVAGVTQYTEAKRAPARPARRRRGRPRPRRRNR